MPKRLIVRLRRTFKQNRGLLPALLGIVFVASTAAGYFLYSSSQQTPDFNRAAAVRLHERLVPAAPQPTGVGDNKIPKKVFILGLDGLSWKVLEDLIRDGELPAFERLIAEGAIAPMRTHDSLLSPVIWTSIATGKRPEKTGIWGYVDERNELVLSKQRKAKALWNILNDRGLRVGIFHWPVTFPAEPVFGMMVANLGPGMFIDRASERANPGARLQPPERSAEMLSYFQYSTTIADYLARFNQRYPTVAHLREFFTFGSSQKLLHAIDDYEAIIRKIALDQYRREAFDLTAVYFLSPDLTAHFYWNQEKPSAALRERYRYFDSLLQTLLDEEIDDHTLLLVLSDHGLQNSSVGMKLKSLGKWRGDHEPTAVFIAYGPGVKKGIYLDDVTIYDICPTVLAVLGVPPATDMDGTILTEIFEERLLQRLPEQPVVTHERTIQTPFTAWEKDTITDREIRQRLRSLGYL